MLGRRRWRRRREELEIPGRPRRSHVMVRWLMKMKTLVIDSALKRHVMPGWFRRYVHRKRRRRREVFQFLVVLVRRRREVFQFLVVLVRGRREVLSFLEVRRIGGVLAVLLLNNSLLVEDHLLL